MTWHHISADWHTIRDRLFHRFPSLDRDAVAEPPRDKAHLTRQLAESHDLTLFEAREELEDFLQIEALVRQITDCRSG